MNKNTLPIFTTETHERIYAGFWRRCGALLLDLIFILLASVVFILINNLARPNYFYTMLPLSIFTFLYYVYPVKRWGGTPGKLICRILILKKDGRKAEWKEAIIRYMPMFLLGISTIVARSIALSNMSDSEFVTLSSADRNRQIMELMPSWFKYSQWCNHLWVIIGIIVMMTNEQRRAVHDFFAGTVVVNKKYITMLNQQVDPIVTTPVDKVEAQSTQAHV